MVKVSIVGPADGDVVLDTGAIRMRVLEDGTTTNHRLGMTEIRLAPHTPGPPQHRHAQHDEGFYVLSGTVRFTVGPDSHDAGPGTLVMVPTGAPHTFANPGDTPATVLNTFTPDDYIRYFHDLRAMLTAGHPLTEENLAPLMSRYATEPATDYAPDTPRSPTARHNSSTQSSTDLPAVSTLMGGSGHGA